MRLVTIPFSIKITDTVNSVLVTEYEASLFYEWLNVANPSVDFKRDRPDGTVVRGFYDDCFVNFQVGDEVLKFCVKEQLIHDMDVMWDLLDQSLRVMVETKIGGYE